MLAADTIAYQALLEQSRAVDQRVAEDPSCADLRYLQEDLVGQLRTARQAMEIAWLQHTVR